MRNLFKILNTLLIFCCFALHSNPTKAALFDAADFLPSNTFSGAVLAELMLSKNAGEGAEARLKYGWTDIFNTQALVGLGSSERRFRFGFQNSLNLTDSDALEV